MGNILTSLIFVTAVALTGKLAIAGVYPPAAGMACLLLAHGYLGRWGGRPVEKRLFSSSRRR